MIIPGLQTIELKRCQGVTNGFRPQISSRGRTSFLSAVDFHAPTQMSVFLCQEGQHITAAAGIAWRWEIAQAARECRYPAMTESTFLFTWPNVLFPFNWKVVEWLLREQPQVLDRMGQDPGSNYLYQLCVSGQVLIKYRTIIMTHDQMYIQHLPTAGLDTQELLIMYEASFVEIMLLKWIFILICIIEKTCFQFGLIHY